MGPGAAGAPDVVVGAGARGPPPSRPREGIIRDFQRAAKPKVGEAGSRARRPPCAGPRGPAPDAGEGLNTCPNNPESAHSSGISACTKDPNNEPDNNDPGFLCGGFLSPCREECGTELCVVAESRKRPQHPLRPHSTSQLSLRPRKHDYCTSSVCSLTT